MQAALKQDPIENVNSSCIGFGICVTVCPLNTLSSSKDGTFGCPFYRRKAQQSDRRKELVQG